MRDFRRLPGILKDVLEERARDRAGGEEVAIATKAELARAIRKHISSVSRYMKGTRIPPLPVVEDIEKALGVRLV